MRITIQYLRHKAKLLPANILMFKNYFSRKNDHYIIIHVRYLFYVQPYLIYQLQNNLKASKDKLDKLA